MPPATRGAITKFSQSARLRVFKAFSKIDWSKAGRIKFISLTYPDSVILRDYKRRNTDRYLFMRYLEKYLHKELSTLWRIEWKGRQSGSLLGCVVPHIHLIVPNCCYIDKQVIRDIWSRILHVTGALCTDIREVKTLKQLLCYVSKYIAKKNEDTTLDIASYLNSTGRMWGITRKNLLPMHPTMVSQELSPSAVNFIREFACKVWPNYDVEKGGSFTLLGDEALNLGEILSARGLVKLSKRIL